MTAREESGLLKLAGAVLVGGFLVFFIATAIHPHGSENDHPVIFAKYADTEGWIAIHFTQVAGVIIALGGFVILYRLLAGRGEVQAVDGVALKHTVDAWAAGLSRPV
jgi:hypothetical protein